MPRPSPRGDFTIVSVFARYLVRMWTLLFLSAVASAQAPAEDRPLAIPDGPQLRSRPVRPPPAPAPALDAEKLSAIRRYKAEHLSVQEYSELMMSTTSAYSTYYGMGGWGAVHTSLPYAYRVDGWGVFQGPRRLDSLAYLDAIGDTQGQVQMAQHIRRKRTAGALLYGVGVAGLATTFVASAGVNNARTVAESEQWRVASWGGLGALIGGLVGGSFPTSKARRLATHPGESFDIDAVQSEVERHNEHLRMQLGLTPAEALSVEERRD